MQGNGVPNILSLSLNDRIIRSISDVLGEYWLPPHQMEHSVLQLLDDELGKQFNVRISGETSNIALYAWDSEYILVFSPFEELHKNPILAELELNDALPGDSHRRVFELSERFLERLSFPRVAFINSCVIENHPVPRLSLNTGLLVAALRRAQVADVRLLDMQTGLTIEEIIHQMTALTPDLIGVSISYGQKNIAFELLDAIQQLKEDGLIKSLIVTGNIIPATYPSEFLRRYPASLVATNEGETTVVALVEYLKGGRSLMNVPGISFLGSDGSVIRTPTRPVELGELPLPALDTIPALADLRGALTLEISRGCQWNVCTFCPRDHKAARWKTMPPERAVEQFNMLSDVAGRFGIKKHIFLADEEFVGTRDGFETKRISSFARQLIEANRPMSFDAEARCDQVYDPDMDVEWHVQRMRMWRLCKEAGLDRLFMGVESGSDSQLARFGKGLKAEQSIYAIRILSALGIRLRFGFITFDQLMVGLDEIGENADFLERKDAIMRPIDIDRYSLPELFRLLTEDADFVAQHSAGLPVYTGVSYMLASMEVLINSRFRTMVELAERHNNISLILNKDTPDTNMGRVQIRFMDELVGDIAEWCQRWIDRNYSLAYTVKSLYKVAPEHERTHLMNWMVAHRSASMKLLRALLFIFDRMAERTVVHAGSLKEMLGEEYFGRVERLKREHEQDAGRTQATFFIRSCMEIMIELIASENETLRQLVYRGELTDSKGPLGLSRVLDAWDRRAGDWGLINEVAMPA